MALWVDDAYAAFEETTKRGGKPYLEPVTLTDEQGEVRMSGIYTYGETVHMFVERKNYNGAFMPGYEKWESDYNPEEAGLLYVDHCVGNVSVDIFSLLLLFYWYANYKILRYGENIPAVSLNIFNIILKKSLLKYI